jgi:hypothetical protein
MKKKKAERPTDFEVADADAAFRKLEDAARRLFAAPKKRRKQSPKRSK